MAPLVHPRRLSRRSVLSAPAAALFAARIPASAHARQHYAGRLRIGCDSSQTAAIVALETAASSLREAHPDVEINIEPSAPGNYLIQMALQFATGQAPDVVMLHGTFLGEVASAGFAEPLDAYLAQWEDWHQVAEPFRQSISWEGSIWGVPLQMDSHFLYYRRDIFAAAGLSPDWKPRHPDEILDVAEVIRDGVPDVMPLGLYAGPSAGLDTVGRGFVPLIIAYGGTFKDASGLWIVDSCAIRDALAFYERAYRIDQTVPLEVATGASPVESLRKAMLDGTLAMIHEGSWAYGEWLAENPDVTREHIGYAMMPASDGVSHAVLGAPANTLVMNAGSTQKELAWQFIESVNSVAIQVMVSQTDPHIPARTDAQNELASAVDPFLEALIDSVDSLVLFEPDPGVREIVTIVQHGTGIVASGEAGPDEAAERYTSELSRVFGEDNVVDQACESA